MKLNSNYDIALQLWGIIKDYTKLRKMKQNASKPLINIDKPELGKLAKENCDTFIKEDKVKNK